MKFYLCGNYIDIDADEKEVEQDMYTVIPHFLSSYDRYGYE